MKIFLTGCAGFIGFNTARSLLERGDTVFGIDNLNDYYDVNLKNDRLKILLKHKNFFFKEADISDKSSLFKFYKKVKANKVIHLAAQAGVRYSIEKPYSYIDSNIVGFINILEAVRNFGSEHLIYASTSSVYGANKKMPFSTSDSTDHPLALYAATKKSNELMAHAYSYQFDIPTSGLRFFTVYGPWGRPDMALFKFTKNILLGETIKVFNNGNHTRDFTYIDDIVEGIIRVCDKNSIANVNWDPHEPDSSSSFVPYNIFNIGGNNPQKLMRYIEILEHELSRKAKIEFLPLQKGDVPDTSADVEGLVKHIKYKPEIGIEEGIKNFVNWYKVYFDVEG